MVSILERTPDKRRRDVFERRWPLAKPTSATAGKAKPKTKAPVRRKRRLLTDAEKKERRAQRSFTTRIRATFTNAGFISLPTANVHRQFGDKVGELDHVYVYENIVVVCEDTMSNDRDHLKNKKILFDEIDTNRDELLDWLKADFQDGARCDWEL